MSNSVREEIPEASSPAGAYRVVVYARPDDIADFTVVLERVLGINRVDARIHGHNIPGILPQPLSLDDASRLTDAIKAIGINASVVLASTLPRLERAEVVHRAACLPDGLEISGLTGARHALIEWSDIALVSGGIVPLETAKHYNLDPSVIVSSAPYSHTELTETTAITGFEMWVVTCRPERVFRFEQDRMNYEYLGERKVASAANNFKVFLTDIALCAKDAYLTPAMHALIEFRPVGKYRYPDSAALQRETLLHYLLHREQARTRRVTNSGSIV